MKLERARRSSLVFPRRPFLPTLFLLVLLTLKRRCDDFQTHFKCALDGLGENPHLDPYDILFQADLS